MAEEFNPVTEINKINNEMDSLEGRRKEIASEYHEELLKNDLEILKDVQGRLNNLNTKKAIEYLEEEVILDSIEVVIERTEEALSEKKNEEDYIKRQIYENS